MPKNTKYLIIYFGNEDLYVPKKYESSYIYSIGSGSPVNGNYISINNPLRLNEIAEELRDEYSEWIYKKNEIFLKNGLTFKNELSLFFLTDFSCKRSEFFDTYNTICNLSLITERLNQSAIKDILLVNSSTEFTTALESLFSSSSIKHLKKRKDDHQLLKYFVTNHIYFLKAALISFLNLFSKKQISRIKNLYFSRYPLHFIDDKDKEDKYGKIDKSCENYSISILTDDYHQKVTIREFLIYRKEVIKKRFSLIDDLIKIRDVFPAYLRGWSYLLKWKKVLNNRFIFKGIDITVFCQNELKFSFNRVIRLLMWVGVFERYFLSNSCEKFTYYLHEYPYGRIISYVLSRSKSIQSVGMQHGPSSKRKLVYFLAKDEARSKKPFLKHAPIPDEVLAEDYESSKIYQHSGYQNVKIMKKITRLGYLDEIVKSKPLYTLICPGLHDGALILDSLKEEIINRESDLFIIKPHPRASNEYLKALEYNNLTVSEEHVSKLLQSAKELVVTYSSVGMEADYLDIPVRVIDVPGKVSESPLKDTNKPLT